MTAAEQATLEFYEWETGLRGWHLFDRSVELEPAIVPQGVVDVPPVGYDDGKISLFGNIFGNKKLEQVEKYGIGARVFERPATLTCLTSQPKAGVALNSNDIVQFLFLVSQSQYPVTFEIQGGREAIRFMFLAYEQDAISLEGFLRSYFPEYGIQHRKRHAPFTNDSDIAIVDYGLANEVHRPLASFGSGSTDPLTSVLSVLEGLSGEETVVLQVRFHRTNGTWADSLQSSIRLSDGSSFFADSPEMLPLTAEKVSHQLVAASIRVAVQGKDENASRQVLQRVNQALAAFERPGSNHLIPLPNEGLPYDVHVVDLAYAESHRPGMLLNIQELAGIARLPDGTFPSRKLYGYYGNTHPAPAGYRNGPYRLGENYHQGEHTSVFVDDEARLRHMHVIGSTGVGKSTLLVNMALQDAATGNGFSILDPHGDLIDDVLSRLPPERLDDVILFDPSDRNYPIGINLLQANTEAEEVILSSDLVSVFKRQSSSWGDQMSNILSMAISCFLEQPEPGTLIELRHFLQNDEYRKSIVGNVSDPTLKYFWENDFPKLKKGVAGPILTRLNSFLNPKAIRYSMAVKEGLDFRKILDNRHIFLIKLSQGLIGESNSHLLGTLIISKLYQAALARQNVSIDRRPNHFLYIDEFHNFLTASLPGIITGVRKYGLGLVLAHQNLDQLNRKDSELKTTLLANANIRLSFKVGYDDASALARGTTHFEASDYTSLSVGEAIGRIGGADSDFNLSVPGPSRWNEAEGNNMQIAQSSTRDKYGKNRSEVEQFIASLYSNSESSEEPAVEEDVAVEETEPTIKTTESTPLDDFEKAKAQYHEQEIEKKALRLHRYLQDSIKALGQSYGWKATVEHPITDGGRVDVLLERDSEKVGVEISVTNKEDYEVRNIRKCLDMGCTLVFLLVPDDTKRQSLRQRVEGDASLSNSKVRVTHEAEIRGWFADGARPTTKEQVVKGYRVQVEYVDDPDSENNLRKLHQAVLKGKAKS